MSDGADFGVLQILSAAAYSRGFADRGMRTAGRSVGAVAGERAGASPIDASDIRARSPWPRLEPCCSAARDDCDRRRSGARFSRERRAWRSGRAASTVVFGPGPPLLVHPPGRRRARPARRLRERCKPAADPRGRPRPRCRSACRARRDAGPHGATGLAETLLLTLTATVGGVGLAYVGVRALVVLAPPDVPRLSMAEINVPVLLTTLGVAVLAALAFGLLPTFRCDGWTSVLA